MKLALILFSAMALGGPGSPQAMPCTPGHCRTQCWPTIEHVSRLDGPPPPLCRLPK